MWAVEGRALLNSSMISRNPERSRKAYKSRFIPWVSKAAEAVGQVQAAMVKDRPKGAIAISKEQY